VFASGRPNSTPHRGAASGSAGLQESAANATSAAGASRASLVRPRGGHPSVARKEGYIMVKAIPEGFHTVTPFLNMKDCAKAIELYTKAFGAEVIDRMVTPDGNVMHAMIKIGNSMLMLGEAIQNPPTSSSIHLYVNDADAAFKRAVDAGCKVVMPMADMFWGDRYGLLEDGYGQRWALATHKEDVSPEEMGKRAAALFAPKK